MGVKFFSISLHPLYLFLNWNTAPKTTDQEAVCTNSPLWLWHCSWCCIWSIPCKLLFLSWTDCFWVCICNMQLKQWKHSNIFKTHNFLLKNTWYGQKFADIWPSHSYVDHPPDARCQASLMLLCLNNHKSSQENKLKYVTLNWELMRIAVAFHSTSLLPTDKFCFVNVT